VEWVSAAANCLSIYSPLHDKTKSDYAILRVRPVEDKEDSGKAGTLHGTFSQLNWLPRNRLSTERKMCITALWTIGLPFAKVLVNYTSLEE